MQMCLAHINDSGLVVWKCKRKEREKVKKKEKVKRKKKGKRKIKDPKAPFSFFIKAIV